MPDRRQITDLRIALEGERRAVAQVRAARWNVDALIADAVAAGIPYSKVARLTFGKGLAETFEVGEMSFGRIVPWSSP